MKLIDCSSKKGITFNSFLIVALLASGTFGKVYKVQLKNLNNNNFYQSNKQTIFNEQPSNKLYNNRCNVYFNMKLLQYLQGRKAIPIFL